MKWFCQLFALWLVLGMSVLASDVLADSLYGTCVRKDGSKVDGTVKISKATPTSTSR